MLVIAACAAPRKTLKFNIPPLLSFYSLNIFRIVFLHKNLSVLVGVLHCFSIQYIHWHRCLHPFDGFGLENASLHAQKFKAQRCKWSRAKKCWIEQTTQSSTHHSGISFFYHSKGITKIIWLHKKFQFTCNLISESLLNFSSLKIWAYIWNLNNLGNFAIVDLSVTNDFSFSSTFRHWFSTNSSKLYPSFQQRSMRTSSHQSNGCNLSASPVSWSGYSARSSSNYPLIEVQLIRQLSAK